MHTVLTFRKLAAIQIHIVNYTIPPPRWSESCRPLLNSFDGDVSHAASAPRQFVDHVLCPLDSIRLSGCWLCLSRPLPSQPSTCAQGNSLRVRFLIFSGKGRGCNSSSKQLWYYATVSLCTCCQIV